MSKEIIELLDEVGIEKVLDPECNQLIIDGDDVSARIFDAELDPIECHFNFSNTVEINTEGLNHIILTKDNLWMLEELIDDSEGYFNNVFIEEE